MNPDAERLIDLATHALTDKPETRLAAAGELRQHIEAHPDIPPALLAQAAASFTRADAHPRRGRWRVVLYLTTLLVSLPALVHSAWQCAWFAAVQRVTAPLAASNPRLPDILRGLKPQEKLLLLGDLTATRDTERWKALWDSAPDNPAYLSEYAVAYFSEHKELSPEILAAAARLDPDNGWLPALAAAGTAEGAVSRGPLTTKEKTEGKTPVWKISDEKRLRETLARIHQVAAKPRFTTYQTELFQQRIPLLPERTDFVNQMLAMTYVATHGTAIVVHLQKLSNALAAGAQQCAARQDIAGFKQITDDWMRLVQTTARGGETMVELLVARAFFTNPLANFRDAAQALGLEEETRRFADLHQGAQAEKEARKQRGRTSPVADLVTSHGTVFACLVLPMIVSQVANPPAITGNDLRPGRYAEHALFERAGSLLAWAALGLCAGFAALSRYHSNPPARGLAARMLDLLRASDWAWILLGGVMLPVLWYLAITRLTPLSAREWSLHSTAFIQASCQFGALAALMAILPVIIAARCLAKRGAPLGLSTRRPWLAWLAAGATALAIPIFGLIPLGPQELLLDFASVLLGIGLLWLLVGFGRNVFGRSVHAPRRATLARMVLPAWIFGMLIFALAIPLFYAEERHWIQQDRLLEISAAAPALSRYQYALTQVLRAELLDSIDAR
jgi:hypothetical protein